MHSCLRASEPYEFAFAAILFVFHQSQDLVPRSSHSLSWPPFWINFHPPWTNRSRDFCCVPGSSPEDPPFWKSSRRRPWGRGWTKLCTLGLKRISLVLDIHVMIKWHHYSVKLTNGKRHSVYYWVMDARRRLLSTKEAQEWNNFQCIVNCYTCIYHKILR